MCFEMECVFQQLRKKHLLIGVYEFPSQALMNRLDDPRNELPPVRAQVRALESVRLGSGSGGVQGWVRAGGGFRAMNRARVRVRLKIRFRVKVGWKGYSCTCAWVDDIFCIRNSLIFVELRYLKFVCHFSSDVV
jgi:hypothetical protein